MPILRWGEADGGGTMQAILLLKIVFDSVLLEIFAPMLSNQIYIQSQKLNIKGRGRGRGEGEGKLVKGEGQKKRKEENVNTYQLLKSSAEWKGACPFYF